MIKISNILFPTDYSVCAEQAFSHAAFLASHFNAALHVIHVRTTDDLPVHEIAPPTVFPSEGKGFGVPFEEVVLQDREPAMAILNYAEALHADLIVMGTHGRSGLDRVLLGSVAEAVVRDAPCPVYTVRAEAQPPATLRYRRIMVPIDFSAFSGDALRYAGALAEAYGARLTLVHFVYEMVYPVVYGIDPVAPLAGQVAEQAETALHTLGQQVIGETVGYDVQIRNGNPVHAIPAFAEEEDVDLIVIATHGLSGLRHLLLGSVTERVVRAAPCPVFTVRAGLQAAAERHRTQAQPLEVAPDR